MLNFESAESKAKRPRIFRGITQVQSGGKPGRYLARVTLKGKQMSLGYFETKEEAAIAYDKGAIKHHGAHAVLNFPRSNYEEVDNADPGANNGMAL